MAATPIPESQPATSTSAVEPSPKKKRGRPPKNQSQSSPTTNGDLALNGDGMYEEGDNEEEIDGSVSLREADAQSFLIALESLDPAHILDQTVAPSTSLRALIQSSPPPTLSKLRKYIANATKAHPTTKSRDAVDAFEQTCLGLLEDFEKRYEKEGETVKNEDEERATKKQKTYMLHRGLPSLDLFTSASELSSHDLAQLATLEDTDVAAVQPSSSLATIPTLKEINTKLKVLPHAAPKRPFVPPKPSQVALLYYDPFSSFAPTYDSTGATASYYQTTTAKLNKSKIKKWENDHLNLVEGGDKKKKDAEVDVEENGMDVEGDGEGVVDPALEKESSTPQPLSGGELPTKSLAESTPSFVLTSTETALLQSIGLEPSSVVQGLKTVEEERVVWKELERNSELLGVLIRGQWERLKKGKPTADVENDSATQLYESLTSLLSSRPSPSLVPSSERIQQLLPLIVSSLMREPVYQGSLEEKNYKAVKESGMGKKE